MGVEYTSYNTITQDMAKIYAQLFQPLKYMHSSLSTHILVSIYTVNNNLLVALKLVVELCIRIHVWSTGTFACYLIQNNYIF